MCIRADKQAGRPVRRWNAASDPARPREEAVVIALAAHEEEGPRGAFEGLRTRSEGQSPDALLPADPTCDPSSRRCESETAHAAPAREFGDRPPWTFLEEFRLALLSARVRMFDRERFPAS